MDSLNDLSTQNALNAQKQNPTNNPPLHSRLANNTDQNTHLANSTSYTNLITNEGSNTLINRLHSLIHSYSNDTNNPTKIDLCVISGFYNAKALQQLASLKDRLSSICIILGKSEQTTQDSTNNIAFYLDENILDIDAKLDEISASKIAYNFIKNHSIQFYTYTANTLIHSKMYFLHDSTNPKIEQNAIIGSSNLTASGLGLYGDSSNKELNLLCDSKEATKECKIYFDALLSKCKDSTNKVLESLQTSYFYHSPKDILDKIAPYFTNQSQDLSTNEENDLTRGAKAYHLYPFQLTASREIYKRLKTYGVALLADPVGSGKTLSALSLATLYKRIAIIAPAKLKAQWHSYKHDSTDPFILSQNIEFYTYDEAINKNERNTFLKSADLVIIDESHAFRNDNATYRKLKEKISSTSHLLLLSATPINNSYLDLAHQLSLKDTHITINNVPLNPIAICKRANEITNKAQEKPQQDTKGSNESSEIILPPDYYKLCNLIFSRSANEIEQYLKSLGKSLPKKAITIQKLSSIPPHIDFSIDSLLNILGVNDSQNSLSFCIYDPYNERYLPREIISELKSDNLSNLGEYSTPRGFLCMSLIKALESSIDAFSSILDKIIAYYKNFLIKHSNRDFVDFEADFESIEGIYDEILFPQRLRSIIDSQHTSALSQDFYADAQSDLEKLESIQSKLHSYNSALDFAKSAKFQALKSLIDSTPIKREKLIIFTESIVTADALTTALKASFSDIVIHSITGNTSPSEFSDRKKRFSPKSLHHTLKENESEIDILVATDCLSEGQNLQDCANLLNWDIAFNPVRAIQRIGRIWRIGSTHKINKIMHFFPDMDIDSYIDLESKLRYKLEAANSATALENPFLQDQEQRYQLHKDLRTKQLKAMESEFVALEQESNPFINLSNLFSNFDISTKSHLKDGIFSIALDNAPNNAGQNLLFALLQDTSAKDSTTQRDSADLLYPCLYDIANQTLLPSTSLNDKQSNITSILSYATYTNKPQEAFSHLEHITNDYTDINALKDIFAHITSQLNEQIQHYQDSIQSQKKSDGGLVFIEPKTFRLIAWLLINPDFTTFGGTK